MLRDVFLDPNFSIPDPGSMVKKIPDPGSGFASKSLSIFNPKVVFSSRKYDPGCSSGIPDPDPDPLHWCKVVIKVSSPDQALKKIGSRS